MCGRSGGETLLSKKCSVENVQLSKEEIVRKTTLMFVAMVAALMLGSGVALAAVVEGNDRDNRLTGTSGADTIRAYGGDDLVRSLGGPDRIYGGKGNDRLYGGYGNDYLRTIDLDARGIGQRDVVDCGPGYDTFDADFEDRVLSNCEEGSVGGF
jgi:Ca2+-binding RTX toxin-like protein